MDKEIQEILNILITCTEEKDCATFKFCDPCKARNLYRAGYRKQSITAKEIIQEILDNSRPTFDKDGKPIIEINADLTANLCKKYGVNYG